MLLPYKLFPLIYNIQLQSNLSVKYQFKMISCRKCKAIKKNDSAEVNWLEAQNHQSASRPGTKSEATKQPIKRCKCCLQQIDKKPISMWASPKQLAFLGFGFPMFYNLLQFCILLVALLVISNSAVLLGTAIDEDCLDKINPMKQQQTRMLEISDSSLPNSCQSNLIKFSKSSYFNTLVDMIVRIASFIGALIMLICMRESQRKLKAYYNQRTVKISDYSLLLLNLPEVKNIKRKIKKFIQLIHQNCCIEDIIVYPDITFYKAKMQQKNKLLSSKKKCINQTQSEVKELNQLIDKIDLQIHQFCQKYSKIEIEDEAISQKAIIIFTTQSQKEYILKKFNYLNQRQIIQFWGSNSLIQLQKAIEPTEILISNMNIQAEERNYRIIIGWALTILFLSLLTICFYFALQQKTNLFQNSLHNFQKDPVNHSKQYRWALALLFIVLFSVQLFNKFVVKIVLHWITDFQKHYDSSSFQFSYALKYALAMFFTTAIMTLAVEALRFDNYVGQYGVVQQQSIIFILNGTLLNFMWILHPQYYFKRLKQWFYGGTKMTQAEANYLMEDCQYDIGKRYAEVVQVIWFTFLYSSLIPIGSFITVFGFCIYYWIDKYNLLRRSTISHNIGTKLPQNAVTLVSIILILKPLGQLIFDWQLRNTVSIATILMLATGILFNLLPWVKILQWFANQHYANRQQKYSEVKYKFNQNYRNQNLYSHQNISSSPQQQNIQINIQNLTIIKRQNQTRSSQQQGRNVSRSSSNQLPIKQCNQTQVRVVNQFRIQNAEQ